MPRVDRLVSAIVYTVNSFLCVRYFTVMQVDCDNDDDINMGIFVKTATIVHLEIAHSYHHVKLGRRANEPR